MIAPCPLTRTPGTRDRRRQTGARRREIIVMADRQPPTRQLSDRPDLDQLKRQARELHQAFHAGDPTAREEVATHYPGADPDNFPLATTQLVLARAHGFESWPRFVREVERRHSDVADFIDAIVRADIDAVTQSTARPAVRRVIDRPLFEFGTTPLLEAVRRDHRGLVDAILDAGADISVPSDWSPGSFTALQLASGDLAQHLIDRGAEVDVCAAARLGDVETLRRLLAADAKRVHERGGDGRQPLHFATTAAVVDLLIGRGAAIAGRCVDHHSTPLMYAARDHHEAARALLAHGAEPDVFAAAGLDDVAMLDGLLAADPGSANQRINEGRLATPPGTWLIYAWTFGVGSGDQRPTVLHAAASGGHAACCRRLLDAGADPAARGGYDDGTPLHFAAWNGRPATIRLLVDAGAEIDVESGANHEATPLGWAVVAGQVEATRALIEAGATILPRHHTDAEIGIAGTAPGIFGAPAGRYSEIAAILSA
jgi:ankyrin repeat protein